MSFRIVFFIRSGMWWTLRKQNTFAENQAMLMNKVETHSVSVCRLVSYEDDLTGPHF